VDAAETTVAIAPKPAYKCFFCGAISFKGHISFIRLNDINKFFLVFDAVGKRP
jgi:hypothetical protein